MMKTAGYSIWLIPSGKLLKYSSILISQLSKQYNSPNFIPHLTLLGGVIGEESHILEKLDKLALDLKPFKISLAPKIGCEDVWTKSLFVEVKQSNELVEANKKAVKIFGLQLVEYKPHVSLLYSDSLSLPEKREISKTINIKDFEDQFLVDSLYLYKTSGLVSEWKLVKEFKLTS